MKKNGSKVPLPKEASIYDYHFSEKTKLFTLWSEQFKGFEVD
jgi:hypothetical protein